MAYTVDLDEDEKMFQILQDLETIYDIGAMYGDYDYITKNEFIARELNKKNRKKKMAKIELNSNARTEERNRKITEQLKTRTQYLEKQKSDFQEAQQARILQELEEYGVQQNQNWFRRERNRRAALLKLQLKRQANTAYNAPCK